MHQHLARLLVLGLAGVASAQLEPSPGHRLVVPIDSTETHLVDVNGEVVHVWPSIYFPGVSAYLRDDGMLVRTIRVGTPIGPGGLGGGVQIVALDGTVVWDFRYDGPGFVSHHDIELLPNGNILLIAWEDRTTTEAIQAGRDPAIAGPILRPDRIVEIAPLGPTSGQVVWQWHAWDHLVQDFDATKANYHGPTGVADHPELIDINFPGGYPNGGDWLHFNGVDYDPVNDWVIITTPAFEEVWIIDHSTTTAEAAGHVGGNWGKGGDLLYRWGNPMAYRAGGPDDQQLFFPHSGNIVPAGYPGAGNLLVFNNQHPGGSNVVEIELPLDKNGQFESDRPFGPAAPSWVHDGFQSLFISSVERLPNGNTLICSGQQGKVFEVTPTHETVAVHYSTSAFVFQAHYVEWTLWADSDELRLGPGGRVELDAIAGSQHAGRPYLVLGSAAGTSPGFVLSTGAVMPLNYDPLFIGMVTNPNSYPFLNTFGVLDGQGRATAAVELPGGVLISLAGLHFDHAYLVADPGTMTVAHVSNAVGYDLVP